MRSPTTVSRTYLHALLVIGLAVAAALLSTAPAAAQSGPCAPPVTKPIVCENSKPGAAPSTWQIDGYGDDSIQGFSTEVSVNKGQTVSFKIDSDSPSFRIDILRLGYYGGDGARMMAPNIPHSGPSAQPACQTFSDSGLVDCGNWSVSGTWTVPSTAVSGVYIAHLVSSDGGESHITFVVRDESSHSDVVVQTSDTTWVAYNLYGQNSLYHCKVACPPGDAFGYKAAYKVSYNRPVQTEPTSELFRGAEYPMIRFLEANGYDVSYLSGVDVHRNGALIKNHKLFISSGHDEYWSKSQRDAMESARDAGVHMAFFSGNEGFWRTRWEPSSAGASTPDRTIVSYKDTHFLQRQDPLEWTGTWRDPRFTTPEEDVTPENALTGQSFEANSGTSRITVPYEYRQLRMWRNTAAASLAPGQSLQLAPETLGIEWDVDADNGFRPAGSFRLSSTTVTGVELFVDHGTNTKFGQTATHNLTMYRAPSGALVFGAGTMQWAFGLDTMNRTGNPADRNMQQATVNLFADMSVQPATLQSGLVPAAKSTDTTAPTATITSPPATVTDGSVVTLSGTASDAGGGVVAGVEISTDNGETWHRATGTTGWSYSWTAHGAPTARIKVRATDDSGNTGNPGAGTPITVTCPCSLWGNNVTPPTADGGDPSSVEVGLKFRTDTYGTISGIRFYKSAANTGVHTGSLWTADGQRLAQATFTNETATGWQSVTFAEPVEVHPNTTYVASYFAPNGHYAATPDYFYRAPSPGPNGGAQADAAPLRAVRNSGTTKNGVYGYATTSVFPTNSFNAGNYWVDVKFSPTPAPGQVTGVTAAEGGRTSANVTWNAPATGGTVTSYTVTPYVGSTAQAPKTVPGTSTSTTITGLTTGTTYTFKVQATNPNGSGPVSAASNAVTPSAPVVPAAPTGVRAQPGTAAARVSWTASVADGDSPITGQTVTPYVDGVAQTPVQVDASATSTTVSGLTNGTSYTFKVTARNAVGSSPASSASNAVVPQSTIFNFTTPVGSNVPSGPPVELGVKFTADFDGTITGIRFYKAGGHGGTHVGTLWSAAGGILRRATFTGETASGWQAVTFDQPVPVTAGTTYVASYFSSEGSYTATTFGLSSPVDGGPVQAVGNATSPNGLYAYGAAGNFPTSTYNAANYWVDVLYALPQPGQPTGATATAGGLTSANVSWTPPAGGGPVSGYRITPYVGSTPQTPKNVDAPATSATVGGLTTGTTYTFKVQAVNANGPGPASAASNAVTPVSAVVPPAPTGVTAEPATKSARVAWTPSASDGDSAITGQTVTPYVGGVAQTPTQVGPAATSAVVGGLDNGTSYTFKVTSTNGVGTSPASAASSAVTPQATLFDFPTPATPDAGDGNSVALGVKFHATFEGAVTGIRFYKSAANTGTHVGRLWSATGDPLAQATFTNETATGWQSVTFAQPVTVTPGTTYVASYHAPNGHYAVAANGLASGISRPPLEALANSASRNGVYAYGSSSAFPSSSYNAGNYFVDVLYAPAGAPGAPSGVTATPGEASANVSWTPPSSGGPVRSYTITPYIGSTAQTPKTITGTPPATTTKISGLQPGTAYTFRVRASNPTGDGPQSAPSSPVTPDGAVAPGAPTGVAAQGDSKAAIVRWSEPADDGGSPITGYTVTPFVGAAAQTPVTVGGGATSARIGGLTNGTAYSFTVKATNSAGTSPASGATAAVTPRASIFEGATPTTVDGGDTNAISVGVKFRADVDGAITGLRFYKSPANTGTHVGTLWSSTGEELARATFQSETGTGWQALTFPSPKPITAGTTYVASYHAPNGHYSVTPAAFTTNPFANPPLQALANPVSPNGVYAYGAAPGFPTQSYNAANYWVDALFAPAGP